MAAVYAAREGPPSVDLPAQHAPLLAALRAAGDRRQHSDHTKTHALAVELLNDWEAIFQVLSHPELPLTNNAAERALRHWVIQMCIRDRHDDHVKFMEEWKVSGIMLMKMNAQIFHGRLLSCSL